MNHHGLPAISELQDKPVNKRGTAKKCFYGKWLIVLAGAVSLLGVCTSLVISKLLWNEIVQLKAKDAVVESILKKIQQGLPELQSEVRSQQESINEWLNQTKASKINWVYKETAYLVKQASYQLKLANLNGAIEVFNDALNTLDTISSSDASEIKNQLVEVIHQLKSAKTVSRDQIINQLDQLKTQIDGLPLNVPKSEKIPPVSLSKPSPMGVLKPLQESWEQIKQLIIIRHHEKPIEPLITPLQDIYLKQNLQLQLEEACMAVLYRDNDLYHSSLQKNNAWVKQFFDPCATQTKAFLKTIDALLQIHIAPESPEVFDHLKVILTQLESLVQYRTKDTV